MKVIWVHYEPSVRLEFSRQQVKRLMHLALHHYDHKCNEMAKPGGSLHGMSNWAKAVDTRIEWDFAWRELDTLCKVLEQLDYAKAADPMHHVRHKLNMILRDQRLRVPMLEGSELERGYRRGVRRRQPVSSVAG